MRNVRPCKYSRPWLSYRFGDNSHVYHAPKSNCFIAARGAAKLQHTKHCSMYIYLLQNFLAIKMSGAVKPNTPHSPPVCMNHV